MYGVGLRQERRRVMSKALGMRCLWGLCGVLASAFLLASSAQADVTSDLSGSVLVYPKVMWTGTEGRDTVIQLSNTSNNLVYAHCFYVDARTVGGSPLWQVTDFRLVLTKQQPTHWVVSAGRPVNPFDSFPGPAQNLGGAGLDPGAIPPVSPGFTGELKCVQTDASGTPFGGNSLKGEAILVSAEGDASKHNALAILANPDLASDAPEDELLLNNTPFNDGEYNSCANTLLMDHFTDGAPALCEADVCLDTGVCSVSDTPCATNAECEPVTCPIRPYLTVIPCTQDFEDVVPESVTMQFQIVNEFENVFSQSTTVTCWRNFRLADLDSPQGICQGTATSCQSDADCDGIGPTELCDKPLSVFSFTVTGTPTAFTRITPATVADGGIMGIGEELFYGDGGPSAGSAWASWNLQQSGTRWDATVNENGGPVVDSIRIPGRF